MLIWMKLSVWQSSWVCQQHRRTLWSLVVIAEFWVSQNSHWPAPFPCADNVHQCNEVWNKSPSSQLKEWRLICTSLLYWCTGTEFDCTSEMLCNVHKAFCKPLCCQLLRLWALSPPAHINQDRHCPLHIVGMGKPQRNQQLPCDVLPHRRELLLFATEFVFLKGNH